MAIRKSGRYSIQSNLDELIRQAKTLSGLRTKKDVLNKALHVYIESLERQATVKGRSFYELTQHLAGCVEGPADLGHNKNYMQGFGR